jgi:hypothetical protein
MQRRATICAKFGMHLIRTQPSSTRHTFSINAMHGPAGKILHGCLQNFSQACPLGQMPPGKVGRILRHGACCVKKKTTISSRYVAEAKMPCGTAGAPRELFLSPILPGNAELGYPSAK